MNSKKKAAMTSKTMMPTTTTNRDPHSPFNAVTLSAKNVSLASSQLHPLPPSLAPSAAASPPSATPSPPSPKTSLFSPSSNPTRLLNSATPTDEIDDDDDDDGGKIASLRSLHGGCGGRGRGGYRIDVARHRDLRLVHKFSEGRRVGVEVWKGLLSGGGGCGCGPPGGGEESENWGWDRCGLGTGRARQVAASVHVV
ncbi:hypothetical protein HYC85_030928 [Camellia sinensis]|uniref:Uncharacterized protein n=1 Tax=Camellia sinensis TaxID=4442 RepID=A0A7J7FPK4_CAMSI|nr:hypothetical protein HYC85_030928 [Camellia sinensis]